MNNCTFHPEAFTDLVDIWEFIAEDNIEAADGLAKYVWILLKRRTK